MSCPKSHLLLFDHPAGWTLCGIKYGNFDLYRDTFRYRQVTCKRCKVKMRKQAKEQGE